MPEQLLLFSPEIGIAAVARFANWYRLWGWIPYFAQSRWLGIQPEFDPFKYNSFPKNAAQQAWAVTAALRVGMRRAQQCRETGQFPGHSDIFVLDRCHGTHIGHYPTALPGGWTISTASW